MDPTIKEILNIHPCIDILPLKKFKKLKKLKKKLTFVSQICWKFFIASCPTVKLIALHA